MNTLLRGESWLAGRLASPAGRRLFVFALALATLGALLFRLGAAPVVRNAERRCQAVASHMLRTGEWLVPVTNGAPRLQKPPLYYWAAAAAAAPSGELTRFSLRLPAALSAFALLVLVYRWGCSLGGFPCGAASALSLLQMAQFWSMGRRGVAEMLLVSLATLALFLFDGIYWGRRRALVPLFFAALWLAFLAKATTALLLVGAPVATQLALDRSLSRAASRRVVGWAALCAAGCLAWYAAVLAVVPGAFEVLREAALLPLGLTRSVGSASHARPFWFYVPLVFAVSSPAVLLAPVALTRAAQLRGIFDTPRRRFPLVCFASLLLAFSAIPMKQKHYLLPLLPPLALALGTLASELLRHRPELLQRWCRALAIPALALAVPLAIGLGVHLYLADEGPAALSFAVAALVLLSGVLAFAAGRSGALRVFAAAALLASLTAFAAHESSVRPVRERFRYGGPAAVAEAGPRFQAAFAGRAWLRRFYSADERHPARRAVAPTPR